MIEKGVNLKRDNLEVVMEKYYQTMAQIKGNKTKTGQDKEISLAANDASGQRSNGCKKKCWDCGTEGQLWGHPGCAGKKDDSKKCRHCGKAHKDDDCWTLKKNKDKHPKWWGQCKGTEQSMPAVNKDGVECIMMAMDAKE